jgi:hypothetical protein
MANNRKPRKKGVAQLLKSAAEEFEKKNAEYGDAYKHHGHIMAAMFPEGVELLDAHDQNRYAHLNLIVGKLNRYAQNFSNGGHQDSLHDIQVYAAILEELDEV